MDLATRVSDLAVVIAGQIKLLSANDAALGATLTALSEQNCLLAQALSTQNKCVASIGIQIMRLGAKPNDSQSERDLFFNLIGVNHE